MRALLVVAVALLALSPHTGPVRVAAQGDKGCTGTGDDSCLYDWGTCGTCDSFNSLSGCNQRATAHLTIDDGPFDYWTTVLDILAWKQVSATFFVVGQQINGAPAPSNSVAIIQRIVAEGHSIGCHSYTHPHMNTLTTANMDTEIQKCLDAVHSVLPTYTITHFRPPYGECNLACNAQLKSFGLIPSYWDFDTNDWTDVWQTIMTDVDAYGAPPAGNTPVSEDITGVCPTTAPGAIVLMHLADDMGLCALPTVIDRIRFMGWNFVTADQCYGTASQSSTPIPVVVPPPATNTPWGTCTMSGPVPTVPTQTNPCTTNNGGCMTSPVQAVCTNNAGTASCACPSGFTGDGKTTCSCASGYQRTGSGASATCTDINECASNNGGCDPNAKCTNTAGSRTCKCQGSGFTGNGMTCTDINECASSNGGCDALTTCTNTIPTSAGGWDDTNTCSTCPEGYTSKATGNSGSSPCKNVNECATNNGGCSMDTTPVVKCTDSTPVSPTWIKMTCGSCPSGWTGDGLTCTDVDECTDPTACSSLAGVTCYNTVGSFTCQYGTGCDAPDADCPNCPTGYTGDGVGTTGCADINECATNNGGCMKATDGGVCTNTNGGSTCTCETGLSGDGINSCSNINECQLNLQSGGCDPLTTCKDETPESPDWTTRTCTECPAGYDGTGATGCRDVNECAMDNGGCNALRTCSNTPGSFMCSGCPSGYTDNGDMGCSDVNECATNFGGCFLPDTCSNTPGTFSCASCPTGTTGDGITCTSNRQCSANKGGCDALTTCTTVTPTAANGWSAASCGACPAGYSGTGDTRCVNIDECASSPCQNGGTCHDGVNAFTCVCDGFTGPICADAESSASAANLAVIVVPAVLGGAALIGLTMFGVRYARNRNASNPNAADANANGSGSMLGGNKAGFKPPASPAVRSANPSADGDARVRVGSPRPSVVGSVLV